MRGRVGGWKGGGVEGWKVNGWKGAQVDQWTMDRWLGISREGGREVGGDAAAFRLRFDCVSDAF